MPWARLLIRAFFWPLWSGPQAFWAWVWPFLQRHKSTSIAMLPLATVGLAGGLVMALRALANAVSQISAEIFPGGATGVEVATNIDLLLARGSRLCVSMLPPAIAGNGKTSMLFLGVLTTVAVIYLTTAFVSWIFLGHLHARLAGFAGAGRDSGRTSHGSARWGDGRDALEAGCLRKKGDDTGLVLGRVPSMGGVGRLYDNAYVADWHVVTVAASRQGKGRGAIIPTALTYPGAMFICDPKSEIYAVTHQQRLRMGQRIARIDPFGMSGKPTHSIDLFAAVDVKSEDCVAEAGAIAQALVQRDKNVKSDPYWDEQAQNLLQGLILYVASLPKPQATAETLRDILASGPDLLALCAEMSQRDELAFGAVKRLTSRFAGMTEKPRNDVLSSAHRHTAFLDDPRIIRTLSRNDFSFSELKNSRPVTVYLMLPPDMLQVYSRYVRVVMNRALKAAKNTPPMKPKYPVLFLMDEVAQLGRCNDIETQLPIAAGYGVLLWLFFQDRGQITDHYNEGTIFGNAYLQVFGIGDLKMAEYISRRLGNETIEVQGSSQTSNSGTHSSNQSTSNSKSDMTRPLATADEVLRLDKSELLTFVTGQRPQRLKRLDYLTDPVLASLASANPFHSAA